METLFLGLLDATVWTRAAVSKPESGNRELVTRRPLNLNQISTRGCHGNNLCMVFPYFLAQEISANRKSESRQNQDKMSAQTLGIKQAKRSERALIKAFLTSIKGSHINLSENVGRSEYGRRKAERQNARTLKHNFPQPCHPTWQRLNLGTLPPVPTAIHAVRFYPHPPSR